MDGDLHGVRLNYRALCSLENQRTALIFQSTGLLTPQHTLRQSECKLMHSFIIKKKPTKIPLTFFQSFL